MLQDGKLHVVRLAAQLDSAFECDDVAISKEIAYGLLGMLASALWTSLLLADRAS